MDCKNNLTLGSLFDGIGGFIFSAKKCGVSTLWASEIDPFPIAVTKKRFPYVKHLGDIKNLKGSEIPKVHIITGGSPCQDLSIAGKRKGLSGVRSNLFLEQIRIIKEMRNDGIKKGLTNKEINPRFMVWENVPGTFSSAKGSDFRRILEEICKIADETVIIPRPPKNKWSFAGCIMGENFSVAWRVLDAQYFGVPQRRRRIYLVADFGGQSAPEILFEFISLRGNPQAGKDKRKRVADRFKRSSSKSNKNNVTALPFDTSFILSNQSHSNPKYGDPCHTLSSKGHVPKAVIKNCYCISGNILCRKPHNGPNGKGIKEDISYTLNTIDRHAVYCMENQQGNSSILKGKCPTITASAGTSGNNQPWIMEKTTTFNEHTYHSWKNSKIGATIRASGGFCGGGSENLAVISDVIRKLTPLECERLQGFPDYWTLIGNQKSFTNEDFEFWKKIYFSIRKDKKEPTYDKLIKWKNKLGSDSARYKALGNSLAIPCAEFVIRRTKEIGFKN